MKVIDMQRIMLWLAGSLFQVAVIAQDTSDVNWPAEYDPASSSFFVHNEILIHGDPDRVWHELINALHWELWYKGASMVSFVDPSDSLLSENVSFRWKTMGQKFTSTVRAFVPFRYLAWESRKHNIQGYHTWLIIPVEEGCKVVTEESQNGWLVFFEKTFQRNKLKRLHDMWLAELKKRVETSKTGNHEVVVN